MRKGDDARRELMRRAAELFDGRGYDAVSVKDIADSLGWPKSLIYYYCTSKEELVMKAAEMRADAVIGSILCSFCARSCARQAGAKLALSYYIAFLCQ